jgi:repressor LexA
MAENDAKSIGAKIRNAMREAHLTQEEFGNKIGVSQAQINHWVADRRTPTLDSMKKIAAALNKPVDYFTEDLNDAPTQEFIDKIGFEVGLIEVRGISSATEGKFMMEQTEAFIPIKRTNKTQFAIRVEGDCMVDPDDPQNSIYHGNYVIIEKNAPIEEEDVVLAMISSEESTIKRIYFNKENKTVELVPDNPDYEKIVRPAREVKILGKVVDVYRPMKKKRRRKKA